MPTKEKLYSELDLRTLGECSYISFFYLKKIKEEILILFFKNINRIFNCYCYNFGTYT